MPISPSARNCYCTHVCATLCLHQQLDENGLQGQAHQGDDGGGLCCLGSFVQDDHLEAPVSQAVHVACTRQCSCHHLHRTTHMSLRSCQTFRLINEAQQYVPFTLVRTSLCTFS